MPSNFAIEFQTDITENDFDYYVMIEDRLTKVAKGHSDITGAAATLEQPSEGSATPHNFEASVVVYVRPNNVNATEKRENPQLAMKAALDAVERQIRQQRDKLREDRGSLDDLWLAQETIEDEGRGDETETDDTA